MFFYVFFVYLLHKILMDIYMTPLQELIKLESYLTRIFDSDHRVAMAILDYIRNNKKSLIQKEKEVMCQFAATCVRVNDFLGPDEVFEETFNTNEK